MRNASKEHMFSAVVPTTDIDSPANCRNAPCVQLCPSFSRISSFPDPLGMLFRPGVGRFGVKVQLLEFDGTRLMGLNKAVGCNGGLDLFR
jgi:hypothetical protein